MASDTTKPPEKGTSNGRIGSRLRRFWSRRATPNNSSTGPKSPETVPVVVVDKKENTKVVIEVVGGEGDSPAGSRDELVDGHEDGPTNRVEDEKKEDENDAVGDMGSHAGIETGYDSGDAGDDIGNDTDDDSKSAKGGEASGSVPNLWEKAWNSDKVGRRRRNLLQEHLVKPAGSGKRPVTAASRSSSQKVVVDGVIKSTQDRMASYKARWGSGDDNETTLGVARSILLSAQTVKTLLDSIVQFDPTGYGSAAWTVISFSLTLVKNDRDLMDLTFKACDYLADLMARYARIEAQYRESQGKRDKPIEKALMSVYVAILVYAAEVQESNAANPWTRVRKSIISLTGQPLENLKREIGAENAKLEEWQRVVDRERAGRVTEMLNSIEGDTDELLKTVGELAKDTEKKFQKVTHGIETEELRELWRSLLGMEGESQSKIRKILAGEIAWWKNFEDDQQKPLVLKKAKDKEPQSIVKLGGSDDGDDRKSTKTDEEGSEDDDDDDQDLETAPEDKVQGDEFGRWLFRKQEYNDWIKYPQSLLWLHGNSGCGKSALCNAIISDLKEKFEKNAKTKVFASWQFRFDLDDSKRLDFMLVSLLRQLASKCQGFPDKKIFSRCRNYRDEGEAPTETQELMDCLRRFISKIDKDVFLVLGGVDQCPDRQGTRHGDRKLLDIIKELALKGYPNLHILMVSRNEKDIRLHFETNMQEMLVSLDVTEDLRKVLDALINRKLKGTRIASLLKEDPNLKKKIEGRLRHDGQASNSLWASSVLRPVFQCRHAKEIEHVLGKIPDSINTRYQTAFSKVAEVDKERMKRILLWLRWQRRPLSQAEFVAVVDIPNSAAVTEICSRVLIETAKERVEVTGQLRTLEVFRFTHFSVREYLDAVFAKEQEALNKSTKIMHFVRSPEEDAHFQITRRCLDVLRDCATNPRTRTTATAKTGSDTDLDHGAKASFDSDDASQSTGASDDDSDASGAGATDTDSEDDRQSTSTSSSTGTSTSSVVVGGCRPYPARRYAAEHWFKHYAEIDREKVPNEPPGQLGKLESDICSQVLGGTHIMQFWLSTHDPDDGTNETMPSPVYYAVKLNLKEITMQLINVAQSHDDTAVRAAPFDQPGAEGTALQLAAHQGDSMVLEELIKHQAEVNSEKGPHGTAIYASAARGDKGMVEKLLRAGARLDGEDHGDLGSPLHVAAFEGHEDIVELLLKEGRLAVDQPASPFGTALQAASAAMQYPTIKLLLDHKADPNFVGGCFGTAAQAAYACDEGKLNSRDSVIEELRSHGARFLDTPLFWTAAYERATSQPNFLRRLSTWRMPGQDSTIREAYTNLLRNGPATLRDPCVVQLGDRQDLLASVILQWTLPMAQYLDPDRCSRWLVSRVPFQDQLDAIRRAVPQHEVDIHNLCRNDFEYKACFWAGINCILGKLQGLVVQCLDQVEECLEEMNQLHRYEIRRGDQYLGVDPVAPFRWASEDFLSNLLHREMIHWKYGLRIHAKRGREAWNPPWSWKRRHSDPPVIRNHMDRSDLIAMELMQQRQMQRQRQLEGMPRPSTLIDHTGRDRDGREDDVRQVLESSSRAGVWVTSDVLDLVKTLVECGDRCSRYQDAVEGSSAAGYWEHVEDLTFELFSAVIRLALALYSDDHRIDFGKLTQPIQLLTTVRLARIKELDAICE